MTVIGCVRLTRRVAGSVFVVAASAACTGERADAPTTGASATPPPAPAVPLVVPVTAGPANSVVSVQGELSPLRAVDLYARVAGYIKSIPVDRGSRVAVGTLLAEIDAPELAQQRAEAEARLVATRQMAERLRAAARTPGAVAAREVEDADATLRAEEARVAALRDMESMLSLRAPFAGVVTERRAHPGTFVGPAQGANGMVVRLEDHEQLRLTIAVPERFAGGITPGRTVQFTVMAFPGETFRGRVSRVSGSVDPTTRAMPVELDVRAAGRLAPGMFASVAWPVVRSGASIRVPTSAIVETTTRSYVVRVKGGIADLVDVKRGLVDGDMTELFGALTASDSVMRRGSDEVVAGARVPTPVAAGRGSVK